MKKIIGTNTLGYPEVRNFGGLPFFKYEVRKKQNMYKIPAYLYFKIKKHTHQYYWNTFNDFDFHKVELFHFFNCLSVGKTPWITTFETALPRWGDDKISRKGLSLIARDSCKKIIALSECTANIQKKLVREKYSEYEHIIGEKLMVLHPSQKKLIKTYDDKELDDKDITFTIVGNQIFSKGGREVIKVLTEFSKKGHPVKLNIVSNLSYDNYASMTSDKDVLEIKETIKMNASIINHYCNIPNEIVAKILISSHVALLPTYADTYGYFVLEAQAAGCPVITTDIRALPEINNDKIGWVINVPKNQNGDGILSSELDRTLFRNTIYNQLYSVIDNIITSPGLIKQKGIQALEKIDAVNSVENNTRILESMYDQITA